NEVADLEGSMKAAAHPEKEHGSGFDRREQLDDQRGCRRSDREIDDRDVRFLAVNRRHGGPLGALVTTKIVETLEIVIEDRQDDLLAEAIGRRARVTLQHVARDLELGWIDVDSIRARDEIRVVQKTGKEVRFRVKTFRAVDARRFASPRGCGLANRFPSP